MDVMTLGREAGSDCLSLMTPCGNNECCNVDVKWTKYPSDLTDLQRWAKAVEANVHVSKLCILNETQTITASGLVLDQTFGHGGFLPIGKRCSSADIDAIMQGKSALDCSKSPYVSKCHYFLSSPSCGGAHGPCTEWKTVSEFWPLCDNPSLNTSWSVDLDAWIGPECSSATDDQCCYVPLGCKRSRITSLSTTPMMTLFSHASFLFHLMRTDDGGTPFGSPCDNQADFHTSSTHTPTIDT